MPHFRACIARLLEGLHSYHLTLHTSPDLACTPMHPEFPLEPGLIHLNHAAVGPWPRRTAEAVHRFAEANLRAGSRDYPAWTREETRLRGLLARLINAPSPEDIALLKNTSEALSVVAYGLDWVRGDNVVFPGRSSRPTAWSGSRWSPGLASRPGGWISPARWTRRLH